MKKKILVIILSVTIFFSGVQPAKADVWGMSLIGAAFNVLLDNIGKEIYRAILGALKQAAMDTVSKTLNNLVAGASETGAMFIMDWENYLFSSSKGKSNLYLNDFFAVTTRGKSSGANFLSECGYSRQLVENAKKFTINIDYRDLQTDINDFICDALGGKKKSGKNLFTDNWRAFDAWAGKSANNNMGFVLMAQEEQMKKQAEEERIAFAKALAYDGYKGREEEGGIVTSPGSTIKDVHSKSITLSMDSLSSADSLGDIMTAVVTQLATGIIKTGIGNAQKHAQQKIDKNINTMYGGVQDSFGSGTGSGYYKKNY